MPDLPARLTTALSDRYRIERELGAGGMATVYLAEDLKHQRQVAIKVLKPELAAVLGAERFVQEITTTAQLQHPHILPLFDSGTADGFLFYVMPYIEGETLRDKLNRETQLGVEEAVRIAREVADALDYAHRHGVIHRDIKPENILMHDGRPMVADFGIALAVSAAAGGRMTETGMSLGTPHYMSPEQATADKEITGRSDVYSLASVLYEMLTGDPPHVGSSAQQIIVKIIADEARPVGEVRKSVPANVAAALGRALEKLPADRFESAKAFADALADPGFTTTSFGAADAGVRWGRRRGPLVALAALAALSTVMAAWGWLRPRAVPAAPVVEFWVAPPDTLLLPGIAALSPDGTRLVQVFYGAKGRGLYQRLLGDRVWRPIPNAEGADLPFFSPDGKEIGFMDEGTRTLRRVAVDGSSSRAVTTVPGDLAGATWTPDGTIVYAVAIDGTGNPTLSKVPADGGSPEVLIPSDSAVRIFPSWGGGGTILYSLLDPKGRSTIACFSLASKTEKLLVPGFAPHVVEGDRIVYETVEGRLWIQDFHPGSCGLRGEPRVVADKVANQGGALGFFAVSKTGSLVYRASGNQGGRMVVVNRSGVVLQEIPAPAGPMGITHPRFSPDGTRIAYVRNEDANQRGNIWVYALNQGTSLRLPGDGFVADPAWSPDGRWIGYSLVADSEGAKARLVRSRADGTGLEEVISGPADLWQMAFNPVGNDIVFRSQTDLFRATPGRDTVPIPLTRTPALEQHPDISPDGRWLAYTSDESGVNEVYVSSYPDMGSRTIVSVRGGRFPVWSRRGDELFYEGSSGLVAAKTESRGDSFTILDRKTLFRTERYAEAANRNFDVSADGESFIMVQLDELRSIWRVGAISPPEENP